MMGFPEGKVLVFLKPFPHIMSDTPDLWSVPFLDIAFDPNLQTSSPWRHLRPISGFDLLANPRVLINDIVPAIPALGTIDPRLLARVQIDGLSPP